MSKVCVKFEFNLIEDEEEKEYERFMEMTHNYPKVLRLLWEVEQKIFRPNRKYGYSDKKMAELYNNEASRDAVYTAISTLEELYYTFKEELGVNVNDC